MSGGIRQSGSQVQGDSVMERRARLMTGNRGQQGPLGWAANRTNRMGEGQPQMPIPTVAQDRMNMSASDKILAAKAATGQAATVNGTAGGISAPRVDAGLPVGSMNRGGK